MMLSNPAEKYRPINTVDLPDRQWPNRVQRQAPHWCSVDLRDGNQALIEPMDIERKKNFFELLVAIGFKEIEVGFPAASQTDFDFIRQLIETHAIPADVTIQVMTQAREDLIDRTFQALAGASRAVVHVYNATAPVFRDVVFKVDRSGCIDIATRASRLVREQMARYPQTIWTYQYSPETFCFTEADFSLEICNAVVAVMEPTPANKMILNLPTTVEVATANVFADQVEWFCRNIKKRDSVIISVHPHNDRGTAVATAELALLAGAERIEGSLFGNGERTGNLDIVNLAMNLYSAGVSPNLDFSNMTRMMREVEFCNQIPIHPRHPYAGELVFTAFSGSHQDAIKKGFAVRRENPNGFWEVPYIPIDPEDIGRNYEAVIRINSQSGKGGIAYILEREGLLVPRRLQIEFSQIIQKLADSSGVEITSSMIIDTFVQTYLFAPEPFALVDPVVTSEGPQTCLKASLRTPQGIFDINSTSNGPLSALNKACEQLGLPFEIADYQEHAAEYGSSADACAYVEIVVGKQRLFGVGRDGSILNASLNSLISALNRAARNDAAVFNLSVASATQQHVSTQND